MDKQKEEQFEAWAVIELFGHTRLAGKVTEATLGGCAFLRVDIPEANGKPGFTKYLGNGAIYSMTPVSEEIARAVSANCRPAPVQPYELPQRPMLSDGLTDEAVEAVMSRLSEGDQEWLTQKLDEAQNLNAGVGEEYGSSSIDGEEEDEP